ncbi:MAG: helix-turn-helix domain-containing protein [Chloroflexaceae bacterium]|nr:helix-turn-helix domain-containing protein [Chloroflexaceae bacterium]
MTMQRIAWAVALLAIILLSVPSAIGIHNALAPVKGSVAGWMAALGFELMYLGSVLIVATHRVTSDVRRLAFTVSLTAVGVAALLNTAADYAVRVPSGLASGSQFVATFDILLLTLSVVESVVLPALAFAMAVLLHRVAEADTLPLAIPDANALRAMVQEAMQEATMPAQNVAPALHLVKPRTDTQRIADLLNQGYSAQAVADEVGCDVSTVYRQKKKKIRGGE